jgi:hypothetical protein
LATRHPSHRPCRQGKRQGLAPRDLLAASAANATDVTHASAYERRFTRGPPGVSPSHALRIYYAAGVETPASGIDRLLFLLIRLDNSVRKSMALRFGVVIPLGVGAYVLGRSGHWLLLGILLVVVLGAAALQGWGRRRLNMPAPPGGPV